MQRQNLKRQRQYLREEVDDYLYANYERADRFLARELLNLNIIKTYYRSRYRQATVHNSHLTQTLVLREILDYTYGLDYRLPPQFYNEAKNKDLVSNHVDHKITIDTRVEARCGDYTFVLCLPIYQRLKHRFFTAARLYQATRRDSDQKASFCWFEKWLTVLLLRYYPFYFRLDNGESHNYHMFPQIISHLEKYECFEFRSNPLIAVRDQYGSYFPDIDLFFGSSRFNDLEGELMFLSPITIPLIDYKQILDNYLHQKKGLTVGTVRPADKLNDLYVPIGKISSHNVTINWKKNNNQYTSLKKIIYKLENNSEDKPIGKHDILSEVHKKDAPVEFRLGQTSDDIFISYICSGANISGLEFAVRLNGTVETGKWLSSDQNRSIELVMKFNCPEDTVIQISEIGFQIYKLRPVLGVDYRNVIDNSLNTTICSGDFLLNTGEPEQQSDFYEAVIKNALSDTRCREIWDNFIDTKLVDDISKNIEIDLDIKAARLSIKQVSSFTQPVNLDTIFYEFPIKRDKLLNINTVIDKIEVDPDVKQFFSRLSKKDDKDRVTKAVKPRKNDKRVTKAVKPRKDDIVMRGGSPPDHSFKFINMCRWLSSLRHSLNKKLEDKIKNTEFPFNMDILPNIPFNKTRNNPFPFKHSKIIQYDSKTYNLEKVLKYWTNLYSLKEMGEDIIINKIDVPLYLSVTENLLQFERSTIDLTNTVMGLNPRLTGLYTEHLVNLLSVIRFDYQKEYRGSYIIVHADKYTPFSDLFNRIVNRVDDSEGEIKIVFDLFDVDKEEYLVSNDYDEIWFLEDASNWYRERDDFLKTHPIGQIDKMIERGLDINQVIKFNNSLLWIFEKKKDGHNFDSMAEWKRYLYFRNSYEQKALFTHDYVKRPHEISHKVKLFSAGKNMAFDDEMVQHLYSNSQLYGSLLSMSQVKDNLNELWSSLTKSNILKDAIATIERYPLSQFPNWSRSVAYIRDPSKLKLTNAVSLSLDLNKIYDMYCLLDYGLASLMFYFSDLYNITKGKDATAVPRVLDLSGDQTMVLTCLASGCHYFTYHRDYRYTEVDDSALVSFQDYYPNDKKLSLKGKAQHFIRFGVYHWPTKGFHICYLNLCLDCDHGAVLDGWRKLEHEGFFVMIGSSKDIELHETMLKSLFDKEVVRPVHYETDKAYYGRYKKASRIAVLQKHITS